MDRSLLGEQLRRIARGDIAPEYVVPFNSVTEQFRECFPSGKWKEIIKGAIDNFPEVAQRLVYCDGKKYVLLDRMAREGGVAGFRRLFYKAICHRPELPGKLRILYGSGNGDLQWRSETG